MIIEGNMTTQVVLKALGLKEHTLYKVLVKCNKNNPKHVSFLFVGFLTGSYTEIYNQTYDKPMRIIEMYSVEVVADLGSTNDHPPVIQDHDIDEAMASAPFDTDEEQFRDDFMDRRTDGIEGTTQVDDYEDTLP